MRAKRKPKRQVDPNVIAQLNDWVALKARVLLDCRSGPIALAMTGELLQKDKPEVFLFATISREIMVTLVPGIYESQSIQDGEHSTTVRLVGFGGEIYITQLTSDLLLHAAPPPNRIN